MAELEQCAPYFGANSKWVKLHLSCIAGKTDICIINIIHKRAKIPPFHMPRDYVKTEDEIGREAPCDLSVHAAFTLVFRARNPIEPPLLSLFYSGFRKRSNEKVVDLPNIALKRLFSVEITQTCAQLGVLKLWRTVEGKLFASRHSCIVSPSSICPCRSLGTTSNS